MGSRDELIQRSISFLLEVKDMTPGAEMERWLNRKYGEDSQLYQDLSRLIKAGVEEGWAANQEVEGPNYRRSRILEPSAETFQFSITAVYMNSEDECRFNDDDDGDVLRGQYHGHPYGELNLVVPLKKGAELKGLQGWQGPGWTLLIREVATIQRSGADLSLRCSICPPAGFRTISSLRSDGISIRFRCGTLIDEDCRRFLSIVGKSQ